MKSENESENYYKAFHNEGRNDLEQAVFYASGNSSSQKQPESGTILPYSACLIDRSGRQFVCFHDDCLAHDTCFKNELPDESMDFLAMYFHPDDKACLCERIFPDILKFMGTILLTELADYRFSFNHRYIRKDGSIAQFLQEGTLSIAEDNNLPVLNLRVFTEIGDFKTDETMILSILRYSSEQGYKKVYSKVYGNNGTTQLSPREIEIIKLCLEGLSSKMIADRLNLSIHTVKNHKRNCMEKTLTHNITELIHLCIRSHWL
ncbi:MAG: LuxR C-terminal-related transcriptional regulator [Bacteroidales bacterium]|nr:LuxR C-terminal-related transcriptional regulator [Bacteroidales bacterium]